MEKNEKQTNQKYDFDSNLRYEFAFISFAETCLVIILNQIIKSELKKIKSLVIFVMRQNS